jgi:deazaflavin-dependent oxidoreductase (nitroreductase family)
MADDDAFAWVKDHTRSYIETKGKIGQFWDYTAFGGGTRVTSLLLKTVGRKSGTVRVTPLIYGEQDGNYVIVASLGGADHHPAWYLNLIAAQHIDIQVGDTAYRCTWRVAEGAERQRVWDYMAVVYPPYLDYQKLTARIIPLVLLHPEQTIATFET